MLKFLIDEDLPRSTARLLRDQPIAKKGEWISDEDKSTKKKGHHSLKKGHQSHE